MRMNGRYLLDTNAVIALFANDPGVAQGLATAAEVFVPTIALGELYYGVRKSSRSRENLQRLDEFAAASRVIGCVLETAQRYGALKDALRQRGQPIPENDIWIAAMAQQHGLTLVSREEHFRQIDDLLLQTW